MMKKSLPIVFLLIPFLLLLGIFSYHEYKSAHSAKKIIPELERIVSNLELFSSSLRGQVITLGAIQEKLEEKKGELVSGKNNSEDISNLLSEIIEKLNLFEEKAKNLEASQITTILQTKKEILTLQEEINSLSGYPDDFIEITAAALKAFFGWLGPTISISVVIVILLVLLSFWKKGIWKRLFENISSFSFSVGGLSIAGKNVEVQKAQIGAVLEDIDEAVSKVYEEVLGEIGVAEAFSNYFKKLQQTFKQQGIDFNSLTLRATLFVPAYVNAELIQATEYIPPAPESLDKKFGRRFSIRYGIIGKCFRLRKPIYNIKVSYDPETLIRNWGLTFEEAKDQKSNPNSLMAFPFIGKERNDPLGIVYLVAEGEKKFGFDPVWEAKRSGNLFPEDTYANKIFGNSKKTKEYNLLLHELVKVNKKLRLSKQTHVSTGR